MMMELKNKWVAYFRTDDKHKMIYQKDINFVIEREGELRFLHNDKGHLVEIAHSKELLTVVNLSFQPQPANAELAKMAYVN